MNYSWAKILAPEEILKKEFTTSLRYRQAILAADIIISVVIITQNIYAGILVLLLGLLYWLYMAVSKHYAFTDKRVIIVDSFISRNITSINYSQITDIEIDQNVLDRIGGWGTITINTSGTHVPVTNLSPIEDPISIKQSLDQIRDKKLN